MELSRALLKSSSIFPDIMLVAFEGFYSSAFIPFYLFGW